MKKLCLALALTVVGATAASAQGIQLRLGDSDRGWDQPRERVIVRERRGGDWDEDRVRRGRYREVESTGSTGCRTVFVRRENARGQVVRQRIRECD
jgi:hypothetical protein